MTAARKSVPPIYQALRTLLTRAAGPAAQPSDEAVHEMRRETKRIRAALRLLRDCLGETAYARCNAQVRDAARPLAPVRDAAVLLRSACRLPARELIPLLEQERRSVRLSLTAADLSRRAAILSGVRQYVDSRRTPSCNVEAMSDGIHKTYKAGRKAWHRAHRRPDDDRLHEWRKQVKYLANQLDLVQTAFHVGGGKFHRHALHLGDYLGKDRDLAILTAKIDEMLINRGLPAKDKGYRQLKRRLRQERKRLQRKAWRCSKKLFSRSPRRFVQHLWAHHGHHR
jgi:CHAD domain-containing protein